jgi:hypothetical protein
MSDKCIDRRDFLKSGVGGLGSFFFLSANEKKPPETVEEKKGAGKKFLFRTLGKTGFKLPAINMGVMNSDNPNLVRAALNGGMILLDTAQTYQRGTNEKMIGELLQGRPRDSYVIATKARLPVDQKT